VARSEVLIKRSAVKEIVAIRRKKNRQRVVERIRRLAADPRSPGCHKLSGRDRYRIRQGSYRILYSIEDERLIVYVVKVGHRKHVYRGMPS
jgi:mRNA interferase RelE/StbE